MRLRSKNTRSNRRVRAHFRSKTRVGGKAKHQKVFEGRDGTPRMTGVPRPLDGRPQFHPDVTPGSPVMYQARATARRPWTIRKDNRARNKRARASRKRNHG